MSPPSDKKAPSPQERYRAELAELETRGDSAGPDVDTERRLRIAQDEVAEVFGNIAAFWGFTRTQGRIFGLLFLSPEPLDHSTIRDRLGISAGSTSMTLSSLIDWGVVHRRDRLYVAETDMWKLITNVMRRRERAQVNEAINRVSQAIELLAGAPLASLRIRFALERVEHLLAFFKLGRSFLDAFVARRPVHGLITRIARGTARFPAILHNWDPNVRIGS
ncbi:MAG: hypothetical protein H6712_01865 [Myxococcales bacterium]|nr:hypothetical protein [Myxococcales bacterium]MCB9712573.1 hypothetical protein [Myxococcales bacterium]